MQFHTLKQRLQAAKKVEKHVADDKKKETSLIAGSLLTFIHPLSLSILTREPLPWTPHILLSPS